MKEIIKNGAGLFGRLVMINVMCFFISVSMSVLCMLAFTQNIGYKAYGTTDDNSDPVFLYDYYSEDGKDEKQQEYIDKGYTVTTSAIRSELSGTGDAVFLTSTQIICLLLLASFVYPQLWNLGTKDSNLVRFKHKKEDKLKGLKIGILASVPSLFLFITFALAVFGVIKKFPVVLYKFLNCSFYSFIQAICGNAVAAADVAVWQVALLSLLLFIVPAVSYGAYMLGYHNISLGEKFIYKKTK